MRTKMPGYRAAILRSSFVMLIAMSGCHDFLEKPLQGQLTQSNFPSSASDALLATNSAYNDLRTPNFHFGYFPIIDIMSDDARKGSNPSDQMATIGPYDNFTHFSTEGSVYSWWSVLYHAIRTANVVIEKAPSIAMDETLKGRYVGEASFLRALFYFDLARGYGGVPLAVTSTPSTSLARANLSDVYALIISDLQVAIAGLPERSALSAVDAGRATKGAARALLAKVYLFLPQPGILNYIPQPDFVNAEKYAVDVINSGEYKLEPDYADANGINGNYGTESVFEIGALPNESQNTGGDQYGNVQGVRGNPNRGLGFSRPSMDLRAAFEPGDPRLKKTIIDLQDVLDGIQITGDSSTPDITKDGSGATIEVECYSRKVWTPGINVPTQYGHHRRMIRYSDVLLIVAEASNENGKTTQALEYLNVVRARAREGNPILPDITETNKDLLRDIILKERRVELAMEGHRFWDLIRTGKAVSVLGPLGFISGKHELLAIPQSEIDQSQHVIVQNQGWE